MSVAVTRTKLLIPRRRKDLLSRPRFNFLLDDLIEYPFTLISAPAGYGKTSLLIDLASQADFPVCWFSIDPLDLDPSRFLFHFIHAIKHRFPEFGDSAISLLENQADPLVHPTRIITCIVNDIYSSISEHFLIFLDDFHHLNSAPEISSFISLFGQAMDDNTHLAIASRTLIDLPDLPLLIGRRMVKGIGYGDLAFQSGEIQSLFNGILGRDLNDEQIASLLEQTEGWITGLVFTAGADDPIFSGVSWKNKVTNADLYRYLAEQVFEKQTDIIQDFLLKSSLMGEFSADFYQEHLGQSESQDWFSIVSTLQENNLFVQQVDDETSWFRYHALFKDFLQWKLHQEYPEVEKEILLTLLLVFRKSNSWEHALEITRKLSDPVIMAEVLEEASSDLIHQGRIKLLNTWLELVPDNVFELFPALSFLLGISYSMLGETDKGLTLINQILTNKSVFRDPDLVLRGLLCKITTLRLQGQYTAAMSVVDEIHNISKEFSNQKLLAESERETALVYFSLGNINKSVSHFQKSLEQYTDIEDKYNQALVHQDFGLALMEYGKYKKAEQHFNFAINIWNSFENIPIPPSLSNNIGTLLLQTGRYKESNEILKSASKNSKSISDARTQAYIIASKGDLAQALSLIDLCLSIYKKSQRIAENTKDLYLLIYLSINQGTVLRHLNLLTKTLIQLEIAHTFILQGASQNELGLWNLEMGYYHLALEDYPTASQSFQAAEQIFVRTGKPLELAKSRTGLMLSYKPSSGGAPIDLHLEEWITSLKSLETLQPLLPELHHQGQRFKDLIDQLDPAPILESLQVELEHYQNDLPLLQKELSPEKNRNSDKKRRLIISALGQNQVLVSGRKIKASEWIHQKTVRELFFYLLSLEKGATKEQIGLIFWPESSPSQLTCQFKNAIYRLRRSVGKDTILYDADSRTYRFNAEIDYQYDVEAFCETLSRANAEIQSKKKIELLAEAVDLYQHPFSPQMDGVWAEPIRQRLTLQYENALLTIARHKLENDQNQACLDYCKKVIDIEICQEKAYQLSMIAHSNLGDRNSVIRVFSECAEKLEVNLGMKPTLETISIYERSIT